MLKIKSYSCICIVLASYFLFVSCKSADDSQENIGIRFTIQAAESDRVDVYYSYSKDSVFSEKRKKSMSYEGGNVQFIQFTLPKSKLESFRIDFSNNPLQKQCILSEIMITYNQKELKITPELLPIFFTLNEYLSYIPETGALTISEVNGRKDPYLTAKPLLIKRIEIDY